MNKKILSVLATSTLMFGSITAPVLASAAGGGTTAGGGFINQNQSGIGVAGGNVGGTGSTGFIGFVQSAVNWILMFLGLITIIVLIWGGFQMVTAAGDDGKYKKGFTIVKQAVIGLILIGASALIVNLVFNFMAGNAGTDPASGPAAVGTP